MSSWIVPGLAIAAAGWLAILVAAPVLPAPIAAVLYAAGSLICHQIPERSFYLAGFQLPVCARCLGLYAGGAVGSLAAVVAGRTFRARQPVAPHRGPLYVVTAIAAIPTIVTVLGERGLEWPLSNLARAAAAVPLAAVVAFVVVRAVATLHYDECASRRPIGHGQPPTHT